MNYSPKRILVLSTYKFSLSRWESSGLLSREIGYYQTMERLHNVKISIMTYDHNDLKFNSRYTNLKILPKKYTNDLFFSIFAPLIYYNNFLKSTIIKSNQSRGSWTGLVVKLIFPKKCFVVRCGWIRTEAIIKNVEKRDGIKLIITKYLEKLTFFFADLIIVTTIIDKQYLIDYYKIDRKKIFIIPNSINTKIFKRRDHSKVWMESIKIIAVGRFVKLKNFDSLIIACQNIKEIDELILIGSGPEKDKYIQLSNERGVKTKIISNINNSLMPQYMSKADIFVMPQKQYASGMSKVILEAMSCGLITIASDIPPHKQTIDAGVNGFLCGTDSESIHVCLNDVINMDKNSLKIIQENAIKKIQNNYSMENTVCREIEIYKNALKYVE